MKKGTVYMTIGVAMLLTLSLYFVGGTYARYATEYDGDASGQIAAWKVKVNNQGPETKELELNFTEVSDDNDNNVVENKIAPSRKISATIPIDLTGTEVAVDVEVKVDTADETFTTLFGDAASKIKPVVTLDGDNTTVNGDGTITIALADRAAMTGSRNLKIEIEWENADDATSITNDTTVGSKESLDFSIPVTIKLQQHLASDTHTGD